MNQRNWHIQHIRDYYVHLRKEHSAFHKPFEKEITLPAKHDPTFGKFPWLPICDL